ncbi:hypothetical protein STEG23_033589, partial [Scotinomys teguina]
MQMLAFSVGIIEDSLSKSLLSLDQELAISVSCHLKSEGDFIGTKLSYRRFSSVESMVNVLTLVSDLAIVYLPLFDLIHPAKL